MKTLYTFIFASFLFSSIQAQTFIGDTEVETRNVVTNLTVPWEIMWGPDNYIWFTERTGKVSRVNPETGDLFQLLDISAAHNFSEGGLLGMALHPGFDSNPQVFLVYSYQSDGGGIEERLVRYTYDGTALVSPEILIDNIEGAANHNGSRLVIDPADNTLYMTTGDATNQDLPQDLSSLNGKILRLNLDGTVPEDNPFRDSYVWTSGHRNPQGLVLSPNGYLYSSEHGPSTDDEINLIEKGKNYGWPTVKGFCDMQNEKDFCADSNVVEPLFAWTPTIATAGLDFYTHDAIPEWQGKLLLVTLKESDLRSFTLGNNGRSITGEDIWFNGEYGRLRDLCISPDGRVFIATSTRDGRGDPGPEDDRIIEIKAVSANQVTTVNQQKNWNVFPNPVTGNVINIISPGNSEYDIVVYNSTGMKISEFPGLAGKSNQITAPEQSGMYILELISVEYTVRKKVTRF